MEAFFFSIPAVALAEIGDKTQLLALLLAARFRRPLPILAGILVATLANHALAAALGVAAAEMLQAAWLPWLIGLSFVLLGLWILRPDSLECPTAPLRVRGVFLATLVPFFLCEIGDKTQVATLALAAHFSSFALVTLGTTLGLFLANLPAVLLGGFAAERLPLAWIRRAAALAFVALGLATLASAPTTPWG
ncbi:MAG: TMEM165/GDT1 family protein [Kiloniellales bacterium]